MATRRGQGQGQGRGRGRGRGQGQGQGQPNNRLAHHRSPHHHDDIYGEVNTDGKQTLLCGE